MLACSRLCKKTPFIVIIQTAGGLPGAPHNSCHEGEEGVSSSYTAPVKIKRQDFTYYTQPTACNCRTKLRGSCLLLQLTIGRLWWPNKKTASRTPCAAYGSQTTFTALLISVCYLFCCVLARNETVRYLYDSCMIHVLFAVHGNILFLLCHVTHVLYLLDM